MRYFWVRAEDGTVFIAVINEGSWWVPGVDVPVSIEAESVVAECEPPACDSVPVPPPVRQPNVSYVGAA